MSEEQEKIWAHNWQVKVNALKDLIADLRPIVKARAAEKSCDGNEYYEDLLGRIESALAIPKSCDSVPHENH